MHQRKTLLTPCVLIFIPPIFLNHATRITGNSVTLIDNIFFNSIKYHTVSGNILIFQIIFQIFLLLINLMHCQSTLLCIKEII